MVVAHSIQGVTGASDGAFAICALTSAIPIPVFTVILTGEHPPALVQLHSLREGEHERERSQREHRADEHRDRRCLGEV